MGFLCLEADLGAGFGVGGDANDTMNTLSSCCLRFGKFIIYILAQEIVCKITHVFLIVV